MAPLFLKNHFYTIIRTQLARGGDDFANIAGASFPLAFGFWRSSLTRWVINWGILTHQKNIEKQYWSLSSHNCPEWDYFRGEGTRGESITDQGL